MAFATTISKTFSTARVHQGRSTRTERLVVKAAANATAPKKSNKKGSEFCGGLPGNCAPMGDFDPLNFTQGKDISEIKRYREAELTHGRVAMLASVGFIVGENFNPLFDGSIKGPAINHFQQLPAGFWAVVLAGVYGVEFLRTTTGWVDPGEGEGLFKLKEGYEPGSIGWDPLGLKPTDPAELEIMQTKELNHGRLAMFAILGEIVQEEVTGLELFNLQDDGILNDANCPAGVVCDILEKSG